MTKWYLNDRELANTIVTARNINTPWSATTVDVYKQKSVVKAPLIGADTITIDFLISGTDRFGLETTIRAELERDERVRIYSTDTNLYEDQKQIWIAPSSFKVDDKSNKKLRCTLGGFLDRRMVHSCEFNLNSEWQRTNTGGTADMSTSTIHKQGAYSLYKNDNTTGNVFHKFTPPHPLNFTQAKKIAFWFRSTWASTSFNTTRLYIYSKSDFSQYAYWNLDSFSALTWTYQENLLGSPASNNGLQLDNVTRIAVMTQTDSSSYKFIYIDWVYLL